MITKLIQCPKYRPIKTYAQRAVIRQKNSTIANRNSMQCNKFHSIVNILKIIFVVDAFSYFNDFHSLMVSLCNITAQ